MVSEPREGRYSMIWCVFIYLVDAYAQHEGLWIPCDEWSFQGLLQSRCKLHKTNLCTILINSDSCFTRENILCKVRNSSNKWCMLYHYIVTIVEGQYCLEQVMLTIIVVENDWLKGDSEISRWQAPPIFIKSEIFWIFTLICICMCELESERNF